MHSPAHIQKASDSGSSRVRKRPVIQADLEVGKPGDKYEQEADAVAQRVMMQPSMDEEEAVQMQPAEEEELQMQTAEEEELQMQAFGEEEELQMEQMDGEEEMLQMEEAEEEEMLQMQADEEEEFLQAKPMVQAIDGGGMKASPELASKISSTQGTGSPLEPGIQREMGGKMGADFSGVNIHTGSDASAMSSEIGARAFTVGSDVYFNKGQYDPHSSSGKHLLAHELTHTVQQGGSVRREKIQRDEDEAGPSNEYTVQDQRNREEYSINTSNRMAEIPTIGVPRFKVPFGPNSQFNLPVGGSDRENSHISVWEEGAMSGSGFTEEFDRKIEQDSAPNLESNNTPIYYLTLKGGSARQRRGSEEGDEGVIFGSRDTIKRRISRPYWTSSGQYKTHDVDHKRELQLGGGETDLQNLWMLESSANRSSGALISAEINRRIRYIVDESRPHLINPPSFDTVKNTYTINVRNGVSAGRDMRLSSNADPNQNWSLDNVKDGRHLSGLKFLTEAEVEAAGLRGSPNELLVYSNSVGGRPIRIPWDENARNAGRKDDLDNLNLWIGRRGGANLQINSVLYDSSTNSAEGQGGTGAIICTAFPGSDGLIREKTNLAFSIIPAQGVSYGGIISRPSVLQAALHALELRSLSPITMSQVELDDEVGLKGHGSISPTIPLISDANINLIIDADGVKISKVFSNDDFNFPSPFEIKNTSLEIFAGTQGLGIEGRVDFGINQVGEGHVGAAASTSGGFELEGAFNFDSELFDPASIEVEYKDETWTIGGQIGIPEGKVRGVKSATINTTYSEGNFAATGEAELDIPGIERGTMEVNYGEEGFSIGGAFDLSSDIPGIQSGRVEATVSKESGDEEYSVSVAGTARPDIPGVDSTLSIAYNDGAITIEGTADYSRGMLSGTVRLGATNRAIDDNGQPEGEPDDTMRVYGGGSLTLQLTPWLEATAGVTFLPNGEMEVQGRIGLPDTVDVFPRRQIRRNLFTVPTIEIPLFAIPLGPRSIGLVAQIGGGLDFEAGFGPGQLRELYAEVTYNPDREDETTLHGRGVFAIPADAGLTLRGDLGLGVSVAIASLSGGIELAGTLGLEGEALASVDVNWSPQTGIALDAEGRVTVNPKFAFNLNAFARATLGIGWFSVSETWRHRLAGFEWGPDIQFGIVFPVHYREGEPFDLSFDDIEVIYPELDIPNMAKGLARDVKDDLF